MPHRHGYEPLRMYRPEQLRSKHDHQRNELAIRVQSRTSMENDNPVEVLGLFQAKDNLALFIRPG